MDMLLNGSGKSYLKRVRAIPGLVGFWPLGDGGSSFQDLGPNGFTGTFKGTIEAQGVPWAGGYYADFANGFADVYSAGFLAAFDPNEFSINWYVKPDVWLAAADQYNLHFYVDTNNYIRLHQSAAGVLTATWRAGGVTEVISLGCACWPSAWTMLTFTASKSNNRIRLLVNGEYNVFDTDTAAGVWAGSIGSNTCGFGGYRGSTFTTSLVGGLANVAMYDGEITEAQARTLLVNPRMPVLTGLGDSIMQYTSRSSWIQGVAQNLGMRVANHAVSGTSILGAPNGMTAQTVDAANDNASIIILQHGINDADSAAITATYLANVQALQASNPAAQIYGLGILNNTSATASYRDANNARIEAACVAAGIPYWSTDGWIDPATDTGDGVHPNNSGAAKIKTQILGRV